MYGPRPATEASSVRKEVGMRAKLASIHWRQILYSGATLAMLLLSAGAKWRPK
jgi:hypothetical protein